jgi:hypothetical protein
VFDGGGVDARDHGDVGGPNLPDADFDHPRRITKRPGVLAPGRLQFIDAELQRRLPMKRSMNRNRLMKSR